MRNSMASELVRKKEPGGSRDKAEMSMQGLSLLTKKSRYEVRPQRGVTGPQKFLAK